MPVPVVAIFALDDLVEVLLDLVRRQPLSRISLTISTAMVTRSGIASLMALVMIVSFFCGHARFSFLAPLVR